MRFCDVACMGMKFEPCPVGACSITSILSSQLPAWRSSLESQDRKGCCHLELKSSSLQSYHNHKKRVCTSNKMDVLFQSHMCFD